MVVQPQGGGEYERKNRQMMVQSQRSLLLMEKYSSRGEGVEDTGVQSR